MEVKPEKTKMIMNDLDESEHDIRVNGTKLEAVKLIVSNA